MQVLRIPTVTVSVLLSVIAAISCAPAPAADKGQ